MRYACKFSTAELPLSFAKNNFCVGIICFTCIIQKGKDKWCDLPWLNLQQGQTCRAQKKFSLNLICRIWSLFTGNCWLCLQQGWKCKWFIIIMSSRYDSNETISKPIPKPTKNEIKQLLKCSVQSFYHICCFDCCFLQGVPQGEKERGR